MRTVLAAVVLTCVCGCASVPITGREQLSLVSDDAVISAANDEFTKFISEAQRKNAVVTGTESPEAAAALAMVRRVGDRIIDAAGMRSRQSWEIYLVRSNAANAFVTPNGKIVVFTGLLPIAQNEGALAGVLGHEVAHVIAHHMAERMSQTLAGNVAVGAIGVAVASSTKRPLVGAALGLGLQYGVLLPFSREHESEADHIGLFLMAKAGYDPSEFAVMWKRMEAHSNASRSEFVSTHPSPATRYTQLTEWLPQAMVYYAEPTRPLPVDLTEARALATHRAEQSALAPMGTRPTLELGYWYRSRSSQRSSDTTTHVERQEQCGQYHCLVSMSDAGDVVFYTDDLAVPELRSAASALRFDPPLKLAQWPLRVGDAWSQTIAVDRNGTKTSWKVKGDVLAYESVTVPAGTFMAFKIVLAVNGTRFRESWWSPETRTAVRTTAPDSKGGQIVNELIDYERSNDPSGVVEEPRRRFP